MITTLLSALFAVAAIPVAAQQIVYEEVIEEIVTVEAASPAVAAPIGSDRFVGAVPAPVAPAAIPQGIARFGPFRVLDGYRAALVDATGARSPAQFAAMMAAYPGIATIEMIECPGTEDDRANLRLGRMIHARGITMYVPKGGSVRSGGVELFLAGAKRIADPGSEFAVHSWIDDLGREARHFSPNSPENMFYISYYREMGMTTAEARKFYDMTNSVPHAEARWLAAEEMAQWVRLDRADTPRGYLASATLDSAQAVN